MLSSTGEGARGGAEAEEGKKKKKRKKKNGMKNGNFFFLHAASLTIPHPSVSPVSYRSGGAALGSIDLKAPLPAQWESCLAVMRRAKAESPCD